jgi:hypothetical protein
MFESTIILEEEVLRGEVISWNDVKRRLKDKVKNNA